MDFPRLVIAAPGGRSGKTTVALGLVAALSARGLAVQPFKKGPDYIDPGWLTAAGTRPCRNLDPFMMGEETVLSAFHRGAEGADICIVEGAMGLYDGLDLEGTGSTARLARLLRAPILLVVDATRMTRSIAALVSGYQRFETDVDSRGVVLNNVVRSRHERMLVAAIEKYCGIPVLGCVPKSQELAIPDRHLGLVPRAEDERLVPAIETTRRMVQERLDLDRILEIARDAHPLAPSLLLTPPSAPRARVGVMLDRVFTFYYPENLEALRQAGAELAFVDSLADRSLPMVDALYLGGGFPEMFMAALETNVTLRDDVRRRIDGGLPVYAECAGLIYLSSRIRWADRSAEMVGALPCEIEMTGRPQGHGYVEAEVVAENPFLARGTFIRGHEFHNTRVAGLERGKVDFAYRLRRGEGIDGNGNDGLVVGNVMAGYTHLHAFAVEGWSQGIVEAAERHRGRSLVSKGGRCDRG